MIETIYDWLLHIFALIGIVSTLVYIIVGKILYEDEKQSAHEDEILVTKTDQELYDAEN